MCIRDRPQLLGPHFEHADHLLMAQMNAVVIADGQYAAATQACNRVWTADCYHGERP